MAFEMKFPLFHVPLIHPHVFGSQYVSEDPLCLVINKSGYGEYRVIKGEEKEILLIATPCANNQLVLRDPNKAQVALLQTIERHGVWHVLATREGKPHSEKIFSTSGNHSEVKVSLEEKDGLFDLVGFQIRRLANACTIFEEGSSTEIADILPPENGDKFLVEVRPYVDHAFVATLSVIVDFMKFNTEPEGSPPVMGQPRFVPVSYSDVIGLKYMSQGLTKLVFEKAGESAAGEYTVAKVENMEQTVFTLKSLDCHMWVLQDEVLKLIAVLSKEKLTLHSRWSVSCLSGESNADLKIVCSVCKDSIFRIFQSRVNLNATLEKEIETRSRAAAFKVTGSWEHKTCTIYEEDPIKIIAEMKPLENDKFMVEVRDGVDCAFVVSLIAVLIAMKTKSSGKKKGAGLEAWKVALQFVGGVAIGAGQFVIGLLAA